MANFPNMGVGAGPRKKSMPPPPFGAKKPDMAVVIGVGGPKKPAPSSGPDHEAGETPGMEASEEYGAKLAQDIEAAGASVGIHDPAQARKAAGAFFAAAAKCLGADSTDEPPMGDMGEVNESDTENYPA